MAFKECKEITLLISSMDTKRSALCVPPAPPSLVKDQQIVKYQQAVQVGVFDCILMECDRMNGCEAYKKV